MKLAEARRLLNPRVQVLSRRERTLARSFAVADMEHAAYRRLPRPIAGYLAGGADSERTLAANTAEFARWSFTPRVLVDVDDVDLSTSYLGSDWAAPIGLAPTGYTRMFDPAGECAVAQGVAGRGIPYAISTMATTSIPQIVERVPEVGPETLWFQLYAMRDRDLTLRMLDTARDAGVRVLEVAVDAPVSGNRLRDRRTGFTVPPQLTARSVLDIGTRPSYWISMLRSEALAFANFAAAGADAAGGSIEAINDQFSPSLAWDDLPELREHWHGRILIKGLLDADQARRALDAGVDGIHLSNHGGRQLDGAASPLALLAEVRDAVGPDPAIIVDSGIRTGADIATAIALGADAGFIGRPYLWGLVVAQDAGVAHVVDILEHELARTMRLLGVRSIAELRQEGPRLVRRRDR